MNPKYAPRDPEGRRDRLGEEIGEVMMEAGQVLQILAKARRFGLESRPPSGGVTNREMLLLLFQELRRELTDLNEALTLVEDDLVVTPCPALG
jgi:hypothetical protein